MSRCFLYFLLLSIQCWPSYVLTVHSNRGTEIVARDMQLLLKNSHCVQNCSRLLKQDYKICLEGCGFKKCFLSLVHIFSVLLLLVFLASFSFSLGMTSTLLSLCCLEIKTSIQRLTWDDPDQYSLTKVVAENIYEQCHVRRADEMFVWLRISAAASQVERVQKYILLPKYHTMVQEPRHI